MICIHKLRVVTEQQACAYPQFIFLQNPEGVKHTRKNLEVKKEKEREEKQDSFLPGYLPQYYLFTYWLTALLSLVVIERSNLD